MAEYVIHGPSETETEQTETSYGLFIHKALLEGGSKIAMVDARTGREVSYDDLRTKTLKFAFQLNAFGLKENDTITICSPNSLDFYIPAIAALYLGITVAPINFAYVPRELVHGLNISKPRIIFCSAGALDNILIAVKSVPSVEKVIVFGKEKIKNVDNLDKYLESDDILKTSAFVIPHIGAEHVAAIMCSSGTTGLPKGVMLIHTNFINAVTHLRNKDFGQLTSDKISLALLPFFHSYGFTFYLTNIILHLKLIVMDKFEEKLFLSSIEKYKVSLIAMVPAIVVLLAKSPLVDEYNLSSLEEIICAAAPLRKDIEDIVRRRLNLKVLRQGYGLTETTLAMTMTPIGCTKSGTSGLVAPSTSGKIVDPETGKTLGPNQQGELCFKSTLIMKGYCGNPEATSEMIDKDGWLHTGDLGYYDDDKYFYIVDRLKELIKFKGFQVPPAELEELLLTHENIVEAAVIGIPDEKCGELPLAFIIKKPNTNLTEEEVTKFVEENVSHFKRLRGGVKFVEKIPKNASGKILRRVLRESVKSETLL